MFIEFSPAGMNSVVDLIIRLDGELLRETGTGLKSICLKEGSYDELWKHCVEVTSRYGFKHDDDGRELSICCLSGKIKIEKEA